MNAHCLKNGHYWKLLDKMSVKMCASCHKLKEISNELRLEPIEAPRNEYGFWQYECPICHQLMSRKAGSYSHHWTLKHGTPLWKEKQIQALINNKVKEARINEVKSILKFPGLPKDCPKNCKIDHYHHIVRYWAKDRINQLSSTNSEADKEETKIV